MARSQIAEWWRHFWSLPARPRYTIKYEPEKHWQGHWIIYENTFSDWLMPVTSRSSRESAEAWVKAREGTP